MEYQRGIGWVSPPRVEIPMFDGEGVVSAQMKNLVEGNQVQEEEKEDEGVLIFPETLLRVIPRWSANNWASARLWAATTHSSEV